MALLEEQRRELEESRSKLQDQLGEVELEKAQLARELRQLKLERWDGGGREREREREKERELQERLAQTTAELDHVSVRDIVHNMMRVSFVRTLVKNTIGLLEIIHILSKDELTPHVRLQSVMC